jgi:hypothetical protein
VSSDVLRELRKAVDGEMGPGDVISRTRVLALIDKAIEEADSSPELSALQEENERLRRIFVLARGHEVMHSGGHLPRCELCRAVRAALTSASTESEGK